MSPQLTASQCKQAPVRESLSNLGERIERAHNLYTRLQDKISCVIANQLSPVNGKIAVPTAIDSPLVLELNHLFDMVNDLCSKIESDVDTIQL